MATRYPLVLVLLIVLLLASACAPAESNLTVTAPWARAAALSIMADTDGNAGAMGGMADESEESDETDSPATAAHNGAVSAAYMTISNTGGAADRLTSVTTSAAGIVEIHTVEMENDVMRMRPLPDGLEIPSGGEVMLEPGGYHIMLMDLQADLVPGETISLVLNFESGKTITVDAEIRAP